MSQENSEHREKMALFVQGRNSEMDRLIEETERRLVNTQKFLDRIKENEHTAREMLEKMLSDLELTMLRLRGSVPK